MSSGLADMVLLVFNTYFFDCLSELFISQTWAKLLVIDDSLSFILDDRNNWNHRVQNPVRLRDNNDWYPSPQTRQTSRQWDQWEFYLILLGRHSHRSPSSRLTTYPIYLARLWSSLVAIRVLERRPSRYVLRTYEWYMGWLKFSDNEIGTVKQKCESIHGITQ